MQETYNELLLTLIEVFADPLEKWLLNFEADAKVKQRPDYQIEAVRDELLAKHSTVNEALFANIRCEANLHSSEAKCLYLLSE